MNAQLVENSKERDKIDQDESGVSFGKRDKIYFFGEIVFFPV